MFVFNVSTTEKHYLTLIDQILEFFNHEANQHEVKSIKIEETSNPAAIETYRNVVERLINN